MSKVPKLSPWLTTLIGLIVWSILWWGGWQTWLSYFPWLRLGLALGLFITPGMLFSWISLPAKREHTLVHLTTGLLISLAFTGFLGLAARGLQLSFGFVNLGMYLSGAFLWVWASQSAQPARRFGPRPGWADLGMLLFTLAVAIIAAKTAIPSRAFSDDFTYNAQLNYFLNAPAYTFQFDDVFHRLEIARFWLAFWPLAEALLAHLSGLHPVLVTGVFLPPGLVLISTLAIYTLGRQLNFEPPLALLAASAHLFGLLRLTLPDQPGFIFFDRLAEDKVAAAFVLAPILFGLAISFLQTPNKNQLILLGLGALGLMFVHPVILGMSAIICGFCGLLHLMATRNLKAYLQMVAALGLATLLPFALRFTEGTKLFDFSIDELKDSGLEHKIIEGRLQVLENDRFYGVSPALMIGLPYKWTLVAGILSVFLLHKRIAARYIFASLLTLGLFMWPYAGWLFGLALTPYQLWRVTWLMPFGLALAFVTQIGLELLPKIIPGPRAEALLRRGLLLAAHGIILGAMLYLLPWAQGNLAFGVQKPATATWYEDYIEAGEFLQSQVPEGSLVIGGPDRTTNDLLPGLTLNVRLISFRNERGGRTASLWQALIAENTPPAERLALLQENGVNYLLLRENPAWVEAFQTHYPAILQLVFENRKLQLYQVGNGIP